MKINKIAIAGGGTAGWMVASSLKQFFSHQVDVELIESPNIPTVGVGEATIPTLRRFYQGLGMRDVDVMSATGATCKLGIQFNDWAVKGSQFIHPFGLYGQDIQGVEFHHYWTKLKLQGKAKPFGEYSLGVALAENNKFTLPSPNPPSPLSVFDWALHLDAAKFAAHLQAYAIDRGVQHTRADITQVLRCDETGNITELQLADGACVAADLFIDCTGFQSLLLGKALGVSYRDWSEWLKCDSAWAVQSHASEAPVPYTKVNAKEAGWTWCIPLQHRNGNGHVYSSAYVSDEHALKALTDSISGALVAEPKKLSFKAGCREQFWSKNCVAIGLSAGFLEPLESTSIALVQTAIEKIKTLLAGRWMSDSIVNEFNQTTALEYERVRDFLILHYKLTRRTDTEFWRDCASMEIPDSLKHKLDLFKSSGYVVNYRWEMFHQPSWLAILYGFDVIPESYHSRVDTIDDTSVVAGLEKIRQAVRGSLADVPSHTQFIDEYCSAEEIQ